MAKLPYMPFYVGDYLADTQHLTTAEHGAYLLLIMAYWRRGGPLPNDDARLARITCMSISEWNASAYAVREFFQCENGTMTHNRIEKELKKVRAKSEQATKAAQKRWEECGRNADAMRTVMHPESESYPESELEEEREKTPTKKRPRKTADTKHPTLDVPINLAHYTRLCEEYGKSVVDAKITTAINWVASKGKAPYADYSAAADNWLKRDGVKTRDGPDSSKRCAKGHRYFGDVCDICIREEIEHERSGEESHRGGATRQPGVLPPGA